MTVRYDLDDGGMVDFAVALARTPSVSTNDQAAVELAAERFTALGFDRVEIDQVGNAIAVFGTGAYPRLLIDGHIEESRVIGRACQALDSMRAGAQGYAALACTLGAAPLAR